MKHLLQTDFIGRRFVVAVCICAPLVLSAPGVCLAEDASAIGGKAVSTTETQDQPQAALDANQMTLASESLPSGTEQSATADQTPAETDVSGAKQATQVPEQKPSPSSAATPASTEATGEDSSTVSEEKQTDSGDATSEGVTDTADSSSNGGDAAANDSTDRTDGTSDDQEGPLTGERLVDGRWYFYKDDGSFTTGWKKWDDGSWSYFGNDGAAYSSWKKIGGKWYYFDPNNGCHCKSGEQSIQGKTYGFDDSCAMITKWYRWSDGKWTYADKDGAEHAGWLLDRKKWYYLDPTTMRALVSEEREIKGGTYGFDKSCAMVTGWKEWSDGWTYADSNGAELSNWQKVKGTWYYLDPTTLRAAADEELELKGKTYRFDSSCAMVTGWHKWGDGTWSWYDADGAKAAGWRKVSNKWYYLDPTTLLALSSEERDIKGKTYLFEPSCAMHTGWYKWADGWAYYGTDGARTSRWQLVGKRWYYLYPTTKLAAVSKELELGGKWYAFDSSCAMVTGWHKWSDGSWSWQSTNGDAISGWLTLGSKRYYLDPTTLRAVSDKQIINGLEYYFDSSCAMVVGWHTWADGTRTYYDMTKRDTRYGAAISVISEKNRRGGIDALCRDAVYWVTEGNLGYDQGDRYTWQRSGYREGKEVDCSSFVIGLLNRHGYGTGSATYTGDMRGNLTRRGWRVVRVDGKPRKGDILLNDGDHVALYVGEGMVVQASRGEAGHSTSGGRPGNQDGYETNLREYYNYPWSCYLRHV